MNIKYINDKMKINLNKIDTENFNNLSQIYSFTTENISGYFKSLDFLNKNVLTVAASGDHIINAIYCGAKSIIGFDVNYLALVFSELKLIALEQLEYQEFLKFFLINEKNDIDKNKNALSYEIYFNRLRTKLSDNAKENLDILYEKFNNNGYELRNSYIFNNKYDNNSLKIFSNLYLKNEFEFQKAKEKIKDKEIFLINSNFKDIDLNKLPKNETYDIILMSNISDYIKKIYNMETNYLEKYIKEIIYNFKKENNKIVCAYLYNINQEKYRSEIDNPLLRKKIFNKLDITFTEEKFTSVIKNCIDCVIII